MRDLNQALKQAQRIGARYAMKESSPLFREHQQESNEIAAVLASQATNAILQMYLGTSAENIDTAELEALKFMIDGALELREKNHG